MLGRLIVGKAMVDQAQGCFSGPGSEALRALSTFRIRRTSKHGCFINIYDLKIVKARVRCQHSELEERQSTRALPKKSIPFVFHSLI